jgi:hypothetical protein
MLPYYSVRDVSKLINHHKEGIKMGRKQNMFRLVLFFGLFFGLIAAGSGRLFGEPIVVQGFNPAGIKICGSVSILSPPHARGLILLSTERPGDQVVASFTLEGGLGPELPIGLGSEWRLGGSSIFWDVPPNQRLCLKRVSEGWILLCGVGEFRIPQGTFRLNRTFAECVELVKSTAPFLREGAARDLGRLAWSERKEPNRQEDATRILIQLSKDHEAGDSVLLGAIEGLGLVSTSQALERLRELAKEKKPVEGKEGSIEYKRILEAISIIAGTRLLGFQEVQTLLSVDEAAELYLTGKSKWVDECPLSLRITEDKKGTFNAVVALTTHATEKVRLAAVSLLKLMDSELAKPVLERLATSDPSEQVREAAKSKQ